MMQTAKRLYWFKIQSDLLREANHDQNEFWRSIGTIGIGKQRSIPMEVVLVDGSISHNIKEVLNEWKSGLKRY